MIAQINLLIHTKLLLLFSATNHVLHLNEFKKTPKNKIQEAKILVEMMQGKDLIRPYLNREMLYELTEFGKQICENGGWLEHLENQKNEKQKAITKTTEYDQTLEKKASLLVGLKSVINLLSLNKDK